LSELLLSKGYQVHGLTRRSSVDNRARLRPLLPHIQLHEGDLADPGSIWRVINAVRPDEVYNLAAQSHVHTSFAEPDHTGDINALGPVRIMDALRSIVPAGRFYQASTSEIFGQGVGVDASLNEDSPMQPASPYGAAKLYALNMVRIYRRAYGLFACNGILFNHESPRRGSEFVTAKIASFARDLNDGLWDGEPLKLGNLEAMRDWGHARDYVEGMWRMLQQDSPDDYVLATGVARSVRDFVNTAIPDIEWTGEGLEEKGTDSNGRLLIAIDAGLYRPIDVECLIGDAGKAKTRLGWKPQSAFEEIVLEMIA